MGDDYFVVHSCNTEEVPVEATTNWGQRVDAKAKGIVVELVPENGLHGTVTRRYLPENDDDLAGLLQKYKPGTRMVVAIEVADTQPNAKGPPPPTSVTLHAEPKPNESVPVASNIKTTTAQTTVEPTVVTTVTPVKAPAAPPRA